MFGFEIYIEIHILLYCVAYYLKRHHGCICKYLFMSERINKNLKLTKLIKINNIRVGKSSNKNINLDANITCTFKFSSVTL